VARIRVPAGGIAGIQFGLEGTRYIGGGPGRGRAEDADLYFPLENDPFAARPASARVSSAPAPTADAGWRAPIWLGVAGALGAMGLTLAARRTRSGRRAHHG
jgi:hypothetical protein